MSLSQPIPSSDEIRASLKPAVDRQGLLDRSVFVVVPCYNESPPVLAATVGRLVESGASVVVVDDGSTDGSWRRIRRLPVHVLRHPINLGQGAALQTGMDYALARGAAIVVHFDADGQHPVEQIEDLLAPLESGQADLVLGSRFLRREDRLRIPRLRRWTLRLAVLANVLLTGVRLTDAHNGMRALAAEAAAKIRLRENRQAHASEILIQARELGLRLVEVPVAVTYSAYSRSKGQSSFAAVDIVLDLIQRRLRL